jgi:hypothetical protein
MRDTESRRIGLKTLSTASFSVFSLPLFAIRKVSCCHTVPQPAFGLWFCLMNSVLNNRSLRSLWRESIQELHNAMPWNAVFSCLYRRRWEEVIIFYVITLLYCRRSLTYFNLLVGGLGTSILLLAGENSSFLHPSGGVSANCVIKCTGVQTHVR